MVYALGFGISMIKWVDIDRDAAATLLPPPSTQSPIVYAKKSSSKSSWKALWCILGQNDKKEANNQISNDLKVWPSTGLLAVENRDSTCRQGDWKMVHGIYRREFDNP